jgi:tripartite-type tricarboxylate transporter receptor subunit TctC
MAKTPGASLGRRAAIGGGIAALAAAAGRAQPVVAARPARMITMAQPGSSLDIAARVMAEGLSRRRGHPIAVENRPGADGILAAEAFVQARPGEALFYGIHAVVTVTPLLVERLPYNPEADLVPIHPGATDFLGLLVPEASAARSAAALIETARARPGALNWNSMGAGYLAFRNMMQAAGGLDMTYVAYRGTPAALLDLAAGHLQAVLLPLAPATPLLREGRIRLLAVSNPVRSALFPDVPTVAEAGIPAMEVEGAHGLFGWRGMPAPLRDELAAQVAAVLADPAAAARLRTAGMEPRAATTPEAFVAEIARSRAHWAALARAFGARPPG